MTWLTMSASAQLILIANFGSVPGGHMYLTGGRLTLIDVVTATFRPARRPAPAAVTGVASGGRGGP